MGHIHLGVLPNTRKWQHVVALLEDGAREAAVFSAAADAAERDLKNAPNDPVFVEAVRLLAMIPQAARQPEFGAELRALGLNVGDDPSLIDIVNAAGNCLDQVASASGRRSDFGELARRSLLGTLSLQLGDRLPGLISASAADVQQSAASFANSAAFSGLARSFYTRLLSDTLNSWLSRVLSSRVGEARRFADISERSAFGQSLTQYSMEATRIIKEFAGGWYGATLHRDGTISSQRAAAFGAVAFKKITEELKRKRGLDA
ncbi:MAG: hypothetical protein R3D65_17010 [Zhengella sp.]|uniref:hypothetical protein n=1 Tax=Zhengella sp. TaxID=2282762 RepID=UPI003528AC34|nr:hypothetical protein [Brucellaceae bacterium]